MMQAPQTENMRSLESANQPSSATENASIDPLDVLRILRKAGGAFFTQLSLHGQLAQVEWAEEKNRLAKLILFTLLGFACFLCVILLSVFLVLALSWETPYRIHSLLALIAFYALATGFAWRRFQKLSALSSESFAATREEIAVDIAMLKSKL